MGECKRTQMKNFLYEFSSAHGAFRRKLVLQPLEAVCAHEAEIDVAFGAVAEASAYAFAAGVAWS